VYSAFAWSTRYDEVFLPAAVCRSSAIRHPAAPPWPPAGGCAHKPADPLNASSHRSHPDRVDPAREESGARRRPRRSRLTSADVVRLFRCPSADARRSAVFRPSRPVQRLRRVPTGAALDLKGGQMVKVWQILNRASCTTLTSRGRLCDRNAAPTADLISGPVHSSRPLHAIHDHYSQIRTRPSSEACPSGTLDREASPRREAPHGGADLGTSGHTHRRARGR